MFYLGKFDLPYQDKAFSIIGLVHTYISYIHKLNTPTEYISTTIVSCHLILLAIGEVQLVNHAFCDPARLYSLSEMHEYEYGSGIICMR